jgi:hypothetical protein
MRSKENFLSFAPISGIANQYTRSVGGIEEISFESGCKWTGV